MNEILELKIQLSKACEDIFESDLVELAEGNVSIRVSGKNEMIITPSGNDYSNPRPINMVHMGFDGTNFDKLNAPSSEFFMHRIMYQKRKDASCILHTHSPFAATLAVTHQDLPVIIEEMAVQLGGGVKCTNFASAGTEDLPLAALEAMGEQNAVILANHGTLVVGRDLQYCVKAAVIIEKMAKIYTHAQLIGDVHIIPEEKQKKFIRIFKEKYSTN
jgi:ribulose-5-phosphate 4-epimerase/fuculose-1-phosphate aldolase